MQAFWVTIRQLPVHENLFVQVKKPLLAGYQLFTHSLWWDGLFWGEIILFHYSSILKFWNLYFQIDLPDYDVQRREANMQPDEMRAFMKRKGFLPPRTFQERDIVIASTGKIIHTVV